ncbi:hypothetical protein AGMMS4957_11320 [Bacteroidia bacterium]|nr:hypothetical protein AGMMS4957_11320 [Bacteroidia bacterium]
MKKKFLFPFLGLVLGGFTTVCVQSCTDDEDKTETITGGSFVGRLVVETPPFEEDSVLLTFTLSGNSFGTIVMHDVTFNARMPRLEAMTIDGISVVATVGSLTLTGEGIEPTAGDISDTKYIMTDLQGVVTQDSLIVSMKSGSMPLSFRGKRQ